MKYKVLTQSPVVGDSAVFTLRTPGSDECLPAQNPYIVYWVKIYRIDRSYLNDNFKSYTQYNYDPVKVQAAQDAEKVACLDPTEENIKNATRLREDAEATEQSSMFYYSDAVPVNVVGTDEVPAWLRSDPSNALIENVPLDDDGNTQYGVFAYSWDTTGQRAGDYFICWSWSQLPAGDTQYESDLFSIIGDTKLTATIPDHATKENKYNNLLNAYTPEMFKLRIAERDLTPEVIENLNRSVADGFTMVEDIANQLVDIYNPATAEEYMLPVQASSLGVSLRTHDPTLWRRQIANAIPLVKKKGRLSGLREALDQAGVRLVKFTQLWQIISPYSWSEIFNVTEDEESQFVLQRNPILPIDGLNLSLEIRSLEASDYTPVTTDCVDFVYADGVTTMIWVGDGMVEPIHLIAGDTLKVTYQINSIPAGQQSTENYIRTLPLADQRDERTVTYPPKNWNLRVIEEDDPMFDLVIPTRHPYEVPVIFGQIRTEFPFSENIYNMDTYNGSLRDSDNPCDIDKHFIDCCTACAGSKFNLDVEIESLTNDRLTEVMEIIEEFKPFTSVLHTLSFSGLVEEFVNCTYEELDVLVTIAREDTLYPGTCQDIFTRAMENARQGMSNEIRRDVLSHLDSAATATGTASNDAIVLYAPYVRIEALGIDNSVYLSDPTNYTPGTNTNVLEILSGDNVGREFVLSGDMHRHFARIDQGSPDNIKLPLDQFVFDFRISNVVYANAVNEVLVDKIKSFSDPNLALYELPIRTQWDVDNDPDYSGGAWKIHTGSETYDILNVQPDGTLLLDGAITSDASNLDYDLQNDLGNTITSGETGEIEVQDRATVTVTDSNETDLRDRISVGQYALISGQQYRITGFVEGETHKFYIDYDGSNTTTSIKVYRRLAEDIGYLGYWGMKLVAGSNYETSLGIQNGANATGYPWSDGGYLEQGSGTETDHLKENFLILIGTDYYTIDDINGNKPSGYTTFNISGPVHSWGLTGQSTSFTIYRASKLAFDVPEQLKPFHPTLTEFDFETPASGGPPTNGIDRRGKDLVQIQVDTSTPMAAKAAALNSAKRNDTVENISQSEAVSYEIEWRD